MKRRFVLGLIFAILICLPIFSSSHFLNFESFATVTNTSNRMDHVATASQTIFPYTFKIFAGTDLKVYVNGVLKTLTTHYSVSGVLSATGGNVTFVSGLAAGDTVAIIREVPYTQTTHYVPNSPFPASSHENALDRQVMLSQQLYELIGRAPKLGAESALSPSLAAPVAGEYLRWNLTGTGIESTAQLSTLGQYTASGTGAVARTVDSRLGEIISVKDFGAVGDGTSADRTSIQAAITSIGTNGGTIYVPPGTYKLDAALTHSTNPITIQGAGMGVSVLYWSATATGGLDFDFADVTKKVTIRDITLKTDYAGGGNAIDVTWPTTASSIFANCLIENVEIIPHAAANDYWTNGIVLSDAWNSVISNVQISGKTNTTTMSTGITLKGTSVANSIDKSNIYFAYTGISVENDSQGFNVSQCNIVYVTIGVYCNNAAAVDSPQATIIGNHIATHVVGIWLSYRSFSSVSNNYVYKRPESSDDFVGIKLINASHSYVSGNVIAKETATSGSDNGIVIDSNSVIVVDNETYEMETGILLQSESSWATVVGNRLVSATTSIINQGVATSTNIIRDNWPIQAFTTLPVNDATPSVGNTASGVFVTANTSPTTITLFDNGYMGQRFTVLFNDNVTTIDFTSTYLLGNAGQDWTPTAPDWMECLFDGAYWRCAVHDVTQ